MIRSISFGETKLKTYVTPPEMGRPTPAVLDHTTQFCTETPKWQALANYIMAQHSDGIPIYFYGASDGTQAYEFAGHLIQALSTDRKIQPVQILGVEALKDFFPITVSDFSPVMHADLQAGRFWMGNNTPMALAKIPGFSTDLLFQTTLQDPPSMDRRFHRYYFGTSRMDTMNSVKRMALTELFRKQLTISSTPNDTLPTFKSTPPVVIVVNNRWLDLPKQQRDTFFRTLWEQLPKNSLVILSQPKIIALNDKGAFFGLLQFTGFQLVEKETLNPQQGAFGLIWKKP